MNEVSEKRWTSKDNHTTMTTKKSANFVEEQSYQQWSAISGSSLADTYLLLVYDCYHSQVTASCQDLFLLFFCDPCRQLSIPVILVVRPRADSRTLQS